jgi:hypothetical protein
MPKITVDSSCGQASSETVVGKEAYVADAIGIAVLMDPSGSSLCASRRYRLTYTGP